MPESTHYSPCQSYTPPAGRLPVLGKARAEIDKLRSAIANDVNTMINRTAAQADNTLKSAAEKGLLDQKTATELAQTSNVIPITIGIDSTGSPRELWDGTNAVGVIGSQRQLFKKQTDGFDRDAEQKISKIMVDTWSVRQTTDGADAGLAGLSEAEIRAVLNKAREGHSIVSALGFGFVDKTGVIISTVIISDEVIVSGIVDGTSISINGADATYSIDGAPYVDTPGTVNNGQILTMKLTSSASPSTRVSGVIIIGTELYVWNVTTAA